MALGIGKVAVPPTPYYYGARAEWYRREADKALADNQLAKYYELFNRYLEYEQLAGWLPLSENKTLQEENENDMSEM